MLVGKKKGLAGQVEKGVPLNKKKSQKKTELIPKIYKIPKTSCCAAAVEAGTTSAGGAAGRPLHVRGEQSLTERTLKMSCRFGSARSALVPWASSKGQNRGVWGIMAELIAIQVMWNHHE